VRDDWVENPALEELEGPTVETWRDTLGQEFGAGDLIAVATVSGKSPQMVVAEVLRINTHNSKGERHVKTARTGERVTLYRENRVWIGPAEFKDHYTAMETMEPGVGRLSRQAQQARSREFWEAQRRPENWEVSQVPYETDQRWEVQAVTVTARPLLDGRGFGRSDASRQWVWDAEAQTGRVVEVEDVEKTRPVTYSLIGNIMKLPDSVRQLLDGTEPGRREVDW